MPLRYWVGGTGNWDSATTANWSATSGGPSGASVPTAADDVFIDANSGAVTVTKTTSTSCLTLTFTGFTGTWIIANGITLTVTGTAITLGSGMAYDATTTGVLSTLGNQLAITITFAGITIPRLTIGKTTAGTTQTVTISGPTPTIQNLVVTNGVTNAGTALAGGVTITNSFTNTLGPLTGTLLTFSGTCTITTSVVSATIANGFTVTTGSSLQLLSILYISGGTITFSGTATLNAGTFALQTTAAVTTFNTGTVTWYDVNLFNSGGVTHVLLSNLNISRNLTVTPTGGAGTGFNGVFAINVSGSFIVTAGNSFGLGASAVARTTLYMLGTGTFEVATNTIINLGIININGSGNYILGSASRPNLYLVGTIFNLVGTSTANVYSTSGHTLQLQGPSVVIETNNTATGAGVTGGSQIIWGNISLLLNQPVSITYDTTALGNLTSNNATLNGAKLFVAGNLSVTTGLSGLSTIELNGTSNTTWGAGTYQNNIIINKSGTPTPATVTLPTGGTITWGAAGRTLQRTAGNINASTSTVSIPNASVTINNMVFNNLTVIAGSQTITQNQLNTINSSLVLLGSVIFTGTAGWTTNNFTHAGSGFFCTLQAGVTYTVTGLFTMIGTAAGRAVLQSNDVVAVSVTINSLSNQMSITSGSIPNPAIGYVFGSTAFGTPLPAALSNILPNRPTILSGTTSPYTLENPIGATGLTNYAGQVGKKAFFNVSGTTNVVYAATRDIDSNGGITIYAGQSFPDSSATSPNQFRTLNWEPLIAPSGSVYYTWVD